MNADAEAIIEQALRHVLEEQAKLLKRDDFLALRAVIQGLNELALETQHVLSSGIERAKTVAPLIKLASKVETLCDDVSEELWTYIPVTVCSVFENLERALHPAEDKYGAAAELRSHYQNIRVRLLQQTLGARMLDSNSDLGEENERIWQQFLQRGLGDAVRVLRGGVICDYEGNRSKHQIDLMVVPASAHITLPGDSEDGKAHVPVDQVISAIMLSSTLTAAKLRSDWEGLADVPNYPQLGEDHPGLEHRPPAKPHPWPLRYIIGSQSDPIETLKATWEKIVAENLGTPPQFVITLDSGFLYSGATGWPRPRYPGNYNEADDVAVQTGVYSGLGLAWLLTQHQARLAVMQRRTVGPIMRQAAQLDVASLTRATPATYSSKFERMFKQKLPGELRWGGFSYFAHNRLSFNTLNDINDFPFCVPGTNPTKGIFPNYRKGVRWFRYGVFAVSEDLVAFEEWMNPHNKQSHQKRIAVFNSNTTEELTGSRVDALQSIDDLKNLNKLS